MKGKKTGGRQKGVPNKTTTLVKQALLCVYDGMGGDEALLDWARKNPSEFYTKMFRALVPTEEHHAHSGEIKLPVSVTHIHEPRNSHP